MAKGYRIDGRSGKQDGLAITFEGHPMSDDGRKAFGPLLRRTGYSHVAKAAVQETTLCIKEMHAAIADQSFDVLRRIPLLSWPAQIVQAAHEAISAGVYAAIFHGSGALLDVAAILERQHPSPDKPPGRFASGLHSALNGAFGDHLAASNNRLAINMAIRVNGQVVPLDTDALRSAFPGAGRRLCVFVHGLGCDEHCWEWGDPSEAAATYASHIGCQVQTEWACTPLYLRYNSGLPIAENCAQLAVLLDNLLAVWPQPASELLIIGHSMGGLIALGACDQAMALGMSWPQSTRMVICLGSPHLGSPLERLGQLATVGLKLTTITRPLGNIAAKRSQGIKDLRRGPGAPRTLSKPHTIAFRFLGASLTEDVEHPISEFLGDGLVPLSSAIAHEITGDVQCARLGKLGHLRMLNDTRVHRQIREWLGVLGAPAEC